MRTIIWLGFWFLLSFVLKADQALKLQLELVIDNDGQGFSRIQDLAVASDGSVYLLDSKAYALYVFTAEGRLRQRLGRKGEGPGDFTRPYRIALDHNGDLLVTETRSRVSVFSAQGEFKSVMMPWGNRSGFFMNVAYAGPGLFFGIESRQDGSRVQRIVRQQGDPLPVELYSEPGAQYMEGQMSFSYTHSAYSTYHLFCHQDGVSAAALSTGYQVQLLDGLGRPMRRINRDERATLFSAAERRCLEQNIDQIENWSANVIDHYKKRIPERRNFISGLRLSPGLLWVFRTEADITAENSLALVDLFRQDGSYLGRFSLPRRPLYISDKCMYLVGSDQEDVLRVERCRYSLPPFRP